MSHLTDEARAPYRTAMSNEANPNSLEAIVEANPSRRTIIKNGLFGLSIFPVAAMLSACGEDKDGMVTIPNPTPTPSPTPTPTPTPAVSYAIEFTSVAANQDDKVTVPAGYDVKVLLKAGDAIETGVTGYAGSFPTPATAEKWAGGNHDGMEYFELSGVDPNKGGLLAINFEYPDFNILMNGNYDAATATADQKALALSAVGIGVVEVAKGSDGNWAVKAGSQYNKRYTGNSNYRAGGPAAGLLSGTIKGMLNNCSSGRTPWGTYLTCEETTDNYLDPTRPERDYGWVVEIDPLQELAPATKRTAMGRFSHENVAHLTNSDRRVAFYMGDDSTPGCIYKFVPDQAYSTTNRAANSNLLDYGTLYVAKFNADGSGEWKALVQGQNGLVANASDPGDVSQFTTAPAPTPVSFNSQADVLINCASAARVAGGTVMDRPEWITVSPDGKAIFVTLTNNSGRKVTDAANPRVTNRHGHILKFRESGDSPLATGFTWDLFLLAGDPGYAAGGTNLVGNINGDTFSSPDGIRIDPQGRLWVQTDHSVPGTSGASGVTIEQVVGHNAMFYIDQTSKKSKRFLVGPTGCEITGLAYTPDLKTFFVNIQHPTGNWPIAGEQPRSSTVVITRTDGKPVGA
ncbi:MULTISPECIES: PhoX family protein [unclassified Sphingobium]|uniref:PhoX family protein n=1 Tax=unclassified Sphingobium TaxID=2611147 RepID=UPI002224FD05|nr:MULTISPECIES: PhoX family phosphatase [unclassified Sphingobium]MCW2394587.1 secreted PhoX family phosphatase [Sphingobium sp. B8D3B]MCW2418101.1 secreted PhoX family phosphatase [Sphingobium sp. B8D3C]